MASVPEEERFAKNATIMAQAIQDGVQRLFDAGYQTVNPKLIGTAAVLISNFNKHYLIQGFIENSHTACWDKIKERDENFFVENASNIFRYLPMDKVNLFKDLFLTKDQRGVSVVSESLKQQIWCLFDAMIKISIKYIHRGRNPQAFNVDKKQVNRYTASFFDDVDLEYHARVWNLKLEFPVSI